MPSDQPQQLGGKETEGRDTADDDNGHGTPEQELLTKGRDRWVHKSHMLILYVEIGVGPLVVEIEVAEEGIEEVLHGRLLSSRGTIEL